MQANTELCWQQAQTLQSRINIFAERGTPLLLSTPTRIKAHRSLLVALVILSALGLNIRLMGAGIAAQVSQI